MVIFTRLKKRGFALKICIAFAILFWTATCMVFFYSFVEKNYLYPLKYKEEILFYSEKYDLSPTLVSSVINTESSFNTYAISNKGAKGLMQLKDTTAEYIANMMGENGYELFDHETNIKYGCFYLRYLLNKFNDEKTALASYNAGEGNVRVWLKDPRYSYDGKILHTIPFPETDKYLKKIYKSLEKYQKLYGKLLDKL